jgi:hypothetical protein
VFGHRLPDDGVDEVGQRPIVLPGPAQQVIMQRLRQTEGDAVS